MEDEGAKQRLIDYLLGGLEVEERRQIEERYFDDEMFFQEMLIIEEELIDSYIKEELSDEAVELFEKHYLTTAEGRVQVEFARALAEALAGGKGGRTLNAAQAPGRPVRTSRFAAFGERFRPMRWGFVGGLAVVLGGVLLLVMTLYNQASRLEQERARVSQEQQESARLNGELERERERLEQARKRLESAPVVRSGDGKTAIGMLLPMLTRSEQGGQVLSISGEATVLLLQAPVETAGKTYQAALTRDGVEILRLNQVTPRSVSGGKVVEIPLSGGMLSGRAYVLMVKPESDEDDTDIYSFAIQKQ